MLDETMNMSAPLDKLYLIKHKLLSNVVKFSVSQQSYTEFIAHLSQTSNPLEQYTFVSSIECHNPSAVIERIQHSLKEQHSCGGIYQVSPSEALKVVQREALRIPVTTSE
ncbi:MAG: hypothetical protein ACPG46_12030 [Thalassotalea sp.]